MDDELPHSLRSDALDNRRRILESARTLLATEGVDVSMRRIAQEAQVGPATLYRRFPTKQELISAAFVDEVHACHAIIEEALAAPDPWDGFCMVIERTCELHARNRGFTEAFLEAVPDATDLREARAHTLAGITKLASAAQLSGRLRPDFVVDDLLLMLMAHRGIRTRSVASRISASRRFAGIVVRAFGVGPHDAAPTLAGISPDR